LKPFTATAFMAMACECPVLCPEVGALPELLEGELASCLYPVGEIEGATRKAASLIDTAAERRELARAGRRRLEDRYSSQVVAAKYVDLIRRIVAGTT
jgi:glycosyltransferase involved in cell wall biosynthesis